MPFQIDDMRPFSDDPNANGNDPLDSDEQHITKGNCPVCLKRGFVFGPRGGSAMNIECANVECRQRYNVTLDMHQRAVFVQHIGRNGGEWPSEPAR